MAPFHVDHFIQASEPLGMYKEWQMHGLSRVVCILLCICGDDWDQLQVLEGEQRWMDLFDVLRTGYNRKRAVARQVQGFNPAVRVRTYGYYNMARRILYLVRQMERGVVGLGMDEGVVRAYFARFRLKNLLSMHAQFLLGRGQ